MGGVFFFEQQRLLPNGPGKGCKKKGSKKIAVKWQNIMMILICVVATQLFFLCSPRKLEKMKPI